MLNHVIVFSNKSLRRIFATLRLYKIRYSMLENKKNPVFIGVGDGFEFKAGINEGYELSLINEKRLEKNYGLMSITTEKILKRVDFNKNIKKKKIKFFNYSLIPG